ncbi:MAG: hypothetical protein GY906_22330 [bacterium]|nr:hypothetical protein [bacterium]
MSVRDIVKKHLEENGFDGLYWWNGECGCKTDDLAPCGEIGADCEPGYEVPCPGAQACDAGGGCDWHIAPKKSEPPSGEPKGGGQ